MLFAEIGAEGWAVIIASGFVGLTGTITGVATLVIGYLERKATREREAAKEERVAAAEAAQLLRDKEVAKKVEEVKSEVAATTGTLSQQLETVQTKVNGKMTELMEKHGVVAKEEGKREGKAEAKRETAEIRAAVKEAVAVVVQPPPVPPPEGDKS